MFASRLSGDGHRLLGARVSGLPDGAPEAIVRRLEGATDSHVTGDAVTEVREVIERFYERFGAGDLINAFACFAPDCIAVGLSGPMNKDEHMAAARRLKTAMPDCHMELIRTLEAGDEIYVTGRFKGTHKNDLDTPLGTIVAAGKTLDLLFVDYFRVSNGKIVECEVVRDRLGMIAQLGGPSAPT